MLVKERYATRNDQCVKTHLSCGGGGIVGFYTAAELTKWYGDCECSIEGYEKDYGDGAIAWRTFLLIQTDKNYDKEIMEARKQNGNRN